MAPNFQNGPRREGGTNPLVMLLAVVGVGAIFVLGIEVGVRLMEAGMIPLW